MLSAKNFAVVYRIDGNVVTVAPLQIQKGTNANLEGERGTLVLPKWYAQELGLIPLDGGDPT